VKNNLADFFQAKARLCRLGSRPFFNRRSCPAERRTLTSGLPTAELKTLMLRFNLLVGLKDLIPDALLGIRSWQAGGIYLSFPYSS